MNTVKKLWRSWYVRVSVLTVAFMVIAAPGGGKRIGH